MFKFCVFLVFCVASCYAAPGGTYCGETPDVIYSCLSAPKLVSSEISSKCTGSQYSNECDRLTCVFREAKWLNGASVDKAKLTAYFDQFEKDHAEWAPAIQHVKTVCLANELKAQGVYLNCPAYDIMHCALSSFIKHATPSQWSTAASCTYPRAYATDCPVCPSDCFSAQVPIGSCNACYLQPPTA
uniref:Odorant binding protein n=1 Tax=Athetis dissimilis TaxID=1737331 RepID=A0A4D6Q5Y7_ATHDI|nr:odorant binding protein [Athetis dissimilis]